VLVAANECGTLYAPDRLHALRISIKKLRYALELSRTLPGVSVDEAIAVLRANQQRFGRLHDTQILLAEVQAAASVARRTAAAAGFTEMVEALERDCRQQHAELLPHLPKLEAMVRDVKADQAFGLRARRPRVLGIKAAAGASSSQGASRGRRAMPAAGR
jgi:CHAD domain-containing protein